MHTVSSSTPPVKSDLDTILPPPDVQAAYELFQEIEAPGYYSADDRHGRRLERAAAVLAHMASTFSPAQFGALQSAMLADPYRNWPHRALKPFVAGVVEQVKENQKAQRAAERATKRGAR